MPTTTLSLSDIQDIDQATAFYDSLEPVSMDFMWGRWKGAELTVGHPMDGLLGATGWYGKQFDDPETVHPLLFHTLNKKQTFAVNPALVPLAYWIPKWNILHVIINLIRPIVATRKPRARLRMMEFRGQYTAAMIYDHKPINDVFRKVDEDTVLGWMDLKGEKVPYFFILKRLSSSF